jgi:hypothetical protein
MDIAGVGCCCAGIPSLVPTHVLSACSVSDMQTPSSAYSRSGSRHIAESLRARHERMSLSRACRHYADRTGTDAFSKPCQFRYVVSTGPEASIRPISRSQSDKKPFALTSNILKVSLCCACHALNSGLLTSPNCRISVILC